MSRNGSTTTAVLDSQAKAIIGVLQRDGRASYSEIAKQVGLSEAAVRARVGKLMDTGVMQVVAVTDPRRLGFLREAMIGIRVSGDARGIADRVAAIDQVNYLVLTTGRFDILAEIVCVDDDELREVLHGSIRAIPGVVDTETFTYLSIEKEHYDWGTR